MKIALVWASFGPYHYARLKAVSDLLGEKSAIGIQLSNCNQTYAWKVKVNGSGNIVSIFEDTPAERVPFFQLLFRLLKCFLKEKPDVCFVPSYWPLSSVAILIAAKLNGSKCVMMNDTHRGTARAVGMKKLVKGILIKMFDAAFVAGTPQRDYFYDQGFSDKNLFLGYDAIDNDYFALKSDEIRNRKSEFLKQYDLPEHYFLSLGRLIEKKNLSTLILAYQKVLVSSRDCQTHLVIVGSGKEEPQLRELCNKLRLPIYDKTAVGIENRKSKIENEFPGVHFYGFRQIDENPIFYALARVFVLPSMFEEWGLVVNEAMASGLPVVVSKSSGCAADLVEEGVNGFTFDPHNPNDLAARLEQIVFAPDRILGMGIASRNIISKWGCDTFAMNARLAAQAAMGLRKR